jgi:type VI secretion system protein ImpA
MGMLDYDSLIQPFDGDNPCGPDLRADPEFRDIEDAPGDFANQKTPELMGVVQRCDAFLQRTKDQAPAIVALQAAVRVGDFALANAALTLVKGYAELFWEDFHPGPAEEMAIARVNELTALARPAAMTLPLQRAPLARMPAPSQQGFTAAMLAQSLTPTPEWSTEDEAALAAQVESGNVSATQARTVRPNREGGRTLRMIMRTLSADARAADSEANVGGEDMGMDPEAMRRLALGLREQVETAQGQLQAMSDLFYDINTIYDSRAGDSASLGPVLSLIKTIVDDASRFLTMFPAEEGAGSPDASGDETASAGESVSAGGGGGKPKGFVVTTPQSRADVITAMNAIVRFFEENEPTSPVPLMLKRVRAWVEMDFLQLLNEIAPAAIDDAQKLLASPEESGTDYS